MISPRKRLLIGTISVIILLGLWQLLSSTQVVNPIFASSPIGIVQSAQHLADQGLLWAAIGASAKLFAVGFGISLVVGLIAGIILGWYAAADAALDPIVSFLYASPRIALVPLVMLWAGIGFRSQVVVVVITGVFPILINVMAGIRTIDRQLAEVTQSFGGTSFDLLKSVVIPGAIPAIVAGIRQGLVMSLIGVVIAEYFVAGNGIGSLIVDAGQTLKSGEALLGVIIFAAAAIILTSALRAVERRVDRWRS